MYKCFDVNDPFKTREGEEIIDLDKYVEVLKANNIVFTKEQYEEAKRNIDKK